MYVNENIKNTYRIKDYSIREDYLRLDMNENPEGLPLAFFNEVIDLITPQMLATYPQKKNLINLIAKKEGIKEENISLVNGSDEGVKLIFETFTKPGHKIVTASPSFEMYKVYCNMFGLEYVSISYDETFKINIKDLMDNIDEKTDLVVLLNPNSPIGTTYSKDEIMAIVAKAQSCDAMVIIDEAYYYFGTPSYLPYITQYPNILVLRTFSKLCSIAGVRIGFIAGNSEWIHYIENAQLTYNVNAIGILFAEQLMLRPEILETLMRIEKEGRDYLIEELKMKEYEYYAQEGNYVLIKTKKPPIEIKNLLKEEKILIKTYGNDLLKDWIRVTTGSKEIMERFWQVLSRLEEL